MVVVVYEGCSCKGKKNYNEGVTFKLTLKEITMNNIKKKDYRFIDYLPPQTALKCLLPWIKRKYMKQENKKKLFLYAT